MPPIPKLGKQEYQPDDRTLRLARYMLPEIVVPDTYDFDKNKRPIPLTPWGNFEWGNCVICGEANHLLRMERIEQRRTVNLDRNAVVKRYKALSGAEKPGDGKDVGLVVLEAMRDWRNNGWQLHPHKNYSIAAYGEVEPDNRKALRQANYTFHGIHMGFSLPLAASEMKGKWDYNGESGPDWRPGSWGGHLVYSKAFTPAGLQVLTWGQKVFVTNNFIERYCDEAWAVVDSLDNWRVKQTIDVNALMQRLGQVSSHVNR